MAGGDAGKGLLADAQRLAVEQVAGGGQQLVAHAPGAQKDDVVDEDVAEDAEHQAQAVVVRLGPRPVPLQVVQDAAQQKRLNHLRRRWGWVGSERRGKSGGWAASKRSEGARQRVRLAVAVSGGTDGGRERRCDRSGAMD